MVRSFEPPRKGHAAGGNTEKTLLDWALGYACRGWAIIPTRGKEPGCRWKQYQKNRPAEAELRELFRQQGITGLAVLFGTVSGGLACRDFDTMESYQEWKTEHPDLARKLPTVKTARGRHVYFCGPEVFHDFGNGEYRGDPGHYCLLPPSQHPDGPIYAWVVPLPDGRLPTIDPYKVGLLVSGTQSTQSTQEIVCSGGSVPSMPSVCSVFPELFIQVTKLKGIDEKEHPAIIDAILATQPESEGQRHRKLFDLCRYLKAIPALANVKPVTFRPIIQEWHRQALPVIRTKEFSETWGDFLDAWNKVKFAAGQGPVDDAFRRAKEALEANPPKKTAQLYPDEPKMVLLAALCRQLQMRAKDADFFLDCRTAGRLLGVPHKQAWKMLQVLCADGVLELRKRGSQATRQANQYRYIGLKWQRKPAG